MMWHTFIVKRFSEAAFLMEKVRVYVSWFLAQETLIDCVFVLSGGESTQRSALQTGKKYTAENKEIHFVLFGYWQNV